MGRSDTWVEQVKLPIVYEHSRVPGWVSKVAPLDAWAVSIGPFIFCKEEIDERTLTHETIHYRQQRELLFVFQWLLYGLFFLVGLVRWGDAYKAYRNNPFEHEAYDCQHRDDYLDERPWFAWVRYIR